MYVEPPASLDYSSSSFPEVGEGRALISFFKVHKITKHVSCNVGHACQ